MLVFAGFFLLSLLMNIGTFGLRAFAAPQHAEMPVMLAIALVFLFLSRFERRAVHIVLVVGLMLIALAMVYVNDKPSNLSPYLLISIAAITAHKMQLFGPRTLTAVVVLILVTLVVGFWGGGIHGFTIFQRFNQVNFVVAYFAILYFLFEEEIIALRKRRDQLEAQTRVMRPFAELGQNIAGLVHDFRGDIGVLSAIAQIERISGDQALADKLGRVVERLTLRVTSIMYIATAEARTEVEHLELSTLIESAVYYFVGANRDLKHAVRFEVQGAPQTCVCGRRVTVLAIVENVVKNAIEATEGQAERLVFISYDSTDEGVRLTIENTGRPLPWKADSAVDVLTSPLIGRGKTTKVDGNGIGLLNVRAALHELGARMTLSNSERGVIAEILFPAAPVSPGCNQPVSDTVYLDR